MSAQRESHFAPASESDAARLLDLIDELAARVRDTRAMGQGDVAIANGIRAQFMERWLDEWCEAIPQEPLPDELANRIQAAREQARIKARRAMMRIEPAPPETR